MTVSTSVLEIDLRECNDHEIRRYLDSGIAGVIPGRYVRVHVGCTFPPLWISDLLKPDIVWQFVGAREDALNAWELAAKDAER